MAAQGSSDSNCRLSTLQLSLPLLRGSRAPCGLSEPGVCGQVGEGFLPFGQVVPQALHFKNTSCYRSVSQVCEAGHADTFRGSMATDK